MSTALIDPAKLADDVLNASIRHAIFGSDPAVIVKSPPGAGKTFLVECACAVAVGEAGMSVLVVTPNVTQAYDVARRLLGYDLPPFGSATRPAPGTSRRSDRERR